MAEDRAAKIRQSAEKVCKDDGNGITVFDVREAGDQFVVVLTVPPNKKRDYDALTRPLARKLEAEIKGIRVTIDVTPGA